MAARYKYPRTPHLPWSPGATADDRFRPNLNAFIGTEVVVTEKMDGENSSLYCDGLHARSLDSRHHPSRDWLKAFHHRIAWQIPPGWRICGENLYARHSIAYKALKSYFYGFSLWNADNGCMSWDETLEWFARLGIAAPPVLYRGLFDEARLRALRLDLERQEGYVLRLADSFAFSAFDRSVAKWVRPHHVQTEQHWMQQALVANGLAPEKESL